MSKRTNKKAVGISDTWAICGLYALLLALFFIPGIIIDNQPISAFQLMRAAELHQFGNFPNSMAHAHEIMIVPVMCILGVLTTLLMRRSSGKYAFGACFSMLLCAMIGVFQVRYLPAAGGFVIGAAMLVSFALFLVCVICAFIRR